MFSLTPKLYIFVEAWYICIVRFILKPKPPHALNSFHQLWHCIRLIPKKNYSLQVDIKSTFRGPSAAVYPRKFYINDFKVGITEAKFHHRLERGKYNWYMMCVEPNNRWRDIKTLVLYTTTLQVKSLSVIYNNESFSFNVTTQKMWCQMAMWSYCS